MSYLWYIVRVLLKFLFNPSQPFSGKYSVFSYDTFLPDEWPQARLEILAWWKIEHLVEDENCPIDKDFALDYFDERAKITNNQLLKYRYNYFAYLLYPNDNRYAKQSIDALVEVVGTLLPKIKMTTHIKQKML